MAEEDEPRVKLGFPGLGVEAPDPAPPPTLSLLEIPTEEPNFSSNREPNSSSILYLSSPSAFKLARGKTTAAVEGCKHKFESPGLGTGDNVGETRGEVWLGEDEGDRRGEGSGNSSLSSSSAIGDALRGILMSCGEVVMDREEDDEEDEEG